GQAREASRGPSSLPSHVRLRPGAGPVALVWMLSSSGLGFPYSFRRAGDQACYLSPPKVGPGRVELPTSPLSGVRSSQLSYGPDSPGAYAYAPDRGDEPVPQN